MTGISWHKGVRGIGLVFDESDLDVRPKHLPATDGPRLSSTDVEMEILQKSFERPIDRVAAIIAMRLIERHCDIDGVAQLAGLSRRSLQRLIRDEGTSYRKLLNRIRMARAKSFIRETDAPLSDIAFWAGYNDPAHFTRAFRRCFGHPPSVERKLISK
jgi:AraC-like DNA-binding protein